MIAIFYDQKFKALQNNASLNVGKWTIKHRAVDFDEASFTSEPFVEDVNPCFVVLKTDAGKYKYAGFAGVPELDKDNQTTCQISDLRTLLKNEVIVDFGKSCATLKDVFDKIMNAYNAQVNKGDFTLEFDTSSCADYDIQVINELSGKDIGMRPIHGERKINAWEVLLNYFLFYDVYIESRLNIAQKKVVFDFKRAMIKDKQSVVKLWEENILNYGKWVASVNETQVRIRTRTKDDSGNEVVSPYYSEGARYILLNDSSVVRVDNGLNHNIKRELFPTKRKVFESDITELSTEVKNQDETQTVKWTICEADIKAVLNAAKKPDITPSNLPTDKDMLAQAKDFFNSFLNSIAEIESNAVAELAGARYNEYIELDATREQRYKNADLQTSYRVYVSRNIEDEENGATLYKTLPVGEIYEDSTGKHTIKIGRKTDDLICALGY